METRSITLKPEEWEEIDRLRGTQSRGKFIAERVWANTKADSSAVAD